MRDIILPITSKYDPTGVNNAQSGLSGLGKFAAGAGIAIAAGLAVGTVALFNFGKDAVKAAADAEKVARSFENMAANTGFFGNEASDIKKATAELGKHAEKMAALTGIDDEAILSLEKYFMTVPELTGLGVKGLEQLATTTADIAAATGKDLESVGNALAKAMANPETAITKLQKAGVFLSDAQVAVYDSLVKTGKGAEAQGYLLDQLSQKYKGTAEAAASPFEQLQQIIENFKENVGAAFLPILRDFIPQFADALTNLANDPKFIQFLQDMAKSFGELLPYLIDLLPPLVSLAKELIPLLIVAIPILVGVINFLTDVIGSLGDKLTALKDPANALLFWSSLILPPLRFVAAGFEGAATWGEEFKLALISIASPIGGLISFLTNLDYWIGKVVSGFQQLFGFNAKLPTGAQLKMNYKAKGIPGLASGGIVTQPTLAMVGEGAGPEAVIPLDQLNKYAPNASGGGTTYNISVNGGLDSSSAIGEAIVNAIRRYERSSGPVFAKA